MKKYLLIFSFCIFIVGAYYLFSRFKESENETKEENEALTGFDWWYDQRALPGTIIRPDGLGKAYQYTQQ